MDDDPPDTSPAVRWLSYTALAQARGIGRASAERLARRKRWQRMAANDGSTLVRVPEDEATLSPDVAAGISAFYWWRSAMVPYPPELKGMVTWNGMASVPTRDLGEAVRKTGHLNKIAAAFAGIVALATVAR